MQSDRSSAEKSWLGLLLVIVTHVSTTWAKFFIRVNISTVEIWQQSTVAFKLLSPEWQGVCLFRSTGQFFRTGGRELENFGCNTIKFTLFPPPLPSPKTLWIFLWFPRSVFYSPPLGLCWRRLISPPFPPENHVILPKILHPPLPMAKSYLVLNWVIFLMFCS